MYLRPTTPHYTKTPPLSRTDSSKSLTRSFIAVSPPVPTNSTAPAVDSVECGNSVDQRTRPSFALAVGLCASDNPLRRSYTYYLPTRGHISPLASNGNPPQDEHICSLVAATYSAAARYSGAAGGGVSGHGGLREKFVSTRPPAPESTREGSPQVRRRSPASAAGCISWFSDVSSLIDL